MAVSEEVFRQRLAELREALDDQLPALLTERVRAVVRNLRAFERSAVRRGLLRVCTAPRTLEKPSHK